MKAARAPRRGAIRPGPAACVAARRFLGPPVGAANGWCAGSQASGQGGGIYITTEGVTVFLHAVTVAKVTGNTASDGAAFDDIVGPYTLL
jgi:hypothetical protein